MSAQILAVTFGDPCSIGPEIAHQAITDFLRESPEVGLHVFGSPSTWESEAFSFLRKHPKIRFHPIGSTQAWELGRPSAASGFMALESLQAAAGHCLEKKADALVTGPLDKSICAKVDPQFVGQTEFLKDLTKSDDVLMMLKNPDLRVALVTTHLAIKDISAQITAEKIIRKAKIFANYLNKQKDPRPLAILALNPHASDHGLFGNEEASVITPAIEEMKKLGMNVSGPIPADTAFCFSKEYSGFLCMYHDQGLIPLKMSGFESAINVSLGLPFLRTSVDHGTAFDIAGKGRASAQSFLHALREARDCYSLNS